MPTSTAARLHTRAEHPLDAEFVRALFDDTHSGELHVAGLAPAALQQLLDIQFRGQSIQYTAAHPTATGTVVELDGDAVGRALVDRRTPDMLVVDLAVLSEHRRRGAASELLRELADEADTGGRELRLRVRTGNAPARALYERFGFVATGERDGDVLLSRPPAAASATREVSAASAASAGATG